MSSGRQWRIGCHRKMPYADLTADSNQPRAEAAERIAAVCRELHAAHLLTGRFDERGYWFPNEIECGR